MLPMLPFLAGVVAGALGVSALRSGRASQSLQQAGQHLCDAAYSGQDALRKVMARGGVAPAQTPSEPAPTAQPQATRAAPRKRAVAGAGSAPPRAPRKAKSKAPDKAAS